MPKSRKNAAPGKLKAPSNDSKSPLWRVCIESIQADKELNFLQKSAAIAHILERINYTPPATASPAEIKKVLLAAARAEALFWYPLGIDEQEAKRRTFLHKFIVAANDEELSPPPWKMTREDWTNFFRSAEQARQTYLAQFKSKTPLILHSKFRSAFLPSEDLVIIHRWLSAEPGGVSLAHCTAELACEIISTFSEAGHDPKNFSRKKLQLGLVSYSKAEARGHLFTR